MRKYLPLQLRLEKKNCLVPYCHVYRDTAKSYQAIHQYNRFPSESHHILKFTTSCKFQVSKKSDLDLFSYGWLFLFNQSTTRCEMQKCIDRKCGGGKGRWISIWKQINYMTMGEEAREVEPNWLLLHGADNDSNYLFNWCNYFMIWIPLSL